MKTRSLALVILAAATWSLLAGCWRGHRDCREHESWDGNYCHADRGYEHYWDHPDHRDWHPDDHHDDHH
jgi:hypothetical protein